MGAGEIFPGSTAKHPGAISHAGGSVVACGVYVNNFRGAFLKPKSGSHCSFRKMAGRAGAMGVLSDNAPNPQAVRTYRNSKTDKPPAKTLRCTALFQNSNSDGESKSRLNLQRGARVYGMACLAQHPHWLVPHPVPRASVRLDPMPRKVRITARR